jgi:membrane-bound lytic murein transglycosylase D
MVRANAPFLSGARGVAGSAQKAIRTAGLLISLWLTGAWAQEDLSLIDDVVRDGLTWAQENLDERVLRALGDVDQKKAWELFQALQSRLQGSYVVDLAALRQTASTLLPQLEAYEETRPYAAWLRTRMDYFEVAEEFRRAAPAPKVEPGVPLPPSVNPSPEVERQAWNKQLEKRPVPRGAAAYLTRLKPIFKASKVPPELVWVAEVESSFNPAARSPAGAAGLFQIMPQTARSLGLALRPTDERLDAEKNAAAAAKYLGYLHGRFKDWRLALAAYNAGEGNVRGVLNRQKAQSFDQIARHLPAETQMYVPKIEATLRKREGASLGRL